jgi:hypothetical protein
MIHVRQYRVSVSPLAADTTLDLGMEPSPTIDYDEPTSLWEQRLAGIALICVLALVLWQARIAIVDFWNLRGDGKTKGLTFWLVIIATSPLLLYVGVGLIFGRFRERQLFSPGALIAGGLLLLMASAGLSAIALFHDGLEGLSPALIGGAGIGVATVMSGWKRRRDMDSDDVP